MKHYLDYMDNIYANTVATIKKQHIDWKIGKDFTIYREITPVLKGINFQTTMLLRKRNRTSVIFEQDFNGRKTKQYFSEYNIIETLIDIYDLFVDEGNTIYSGMCKLIEDSGTDVNFRIGTEQFSFKGIQYLSNDKLFMTYTGYKIGINDFIGLLNLVIEKDRYSKESNNGKGTILKYILFLLLRSRRTPIHKRQMINILNEAKIYKDNSLTKYKDIINETGGSKLYFKSELFKDIV